jgi:hypothetical protein
MKKISAGQKGAGKNGREPQDEGRETLLSKFVCEKHCPPLFETRVWKNSTK